MKRLRHGDRGRYRTAPEYWTWKGIRRRCLDPTCRGFRDYGARGITVAPEWAGPDGYAVFLAHVGRKPSAGHSIERIDNNLGYVPGNVRWATSKEQGRNKRSNRRLTFYGLTLTLSEWAERTGIKSVTLRARLRTGWKLAEALTTKTAPGGGRFCPGNKANRYSHIIHAEPAKAGGAP